jgi:serine/threonine-protein kinase
MTSEDKLVGTVVEGYRIGRRLGKGGAGKVYLAEEEATGRTVAFKILEPGLFPTEEFHHRFEREMNICMKLKHPHIVPIYTWSRKQEHCYIVMKLVQGSTLWSLVRDAKTPLRTLLRIVEQVCRALGACHAEKIVHRDLKPTNIMAEGAHGYLMDFGLARHVTGDTISSPQFVLGTPMYMSPEQVRGERATPASDVFAMGTILYEIVAGRNPFTYNMTEPEQEKHSGVLMIMERIATAQFLPLESIDPQVPRALRELIDRCLEKDPAGRFADGAELAAALDPLIRDPAVERYEQIREGKEPPPVSTQEVTRAQEAAPVKSSAENTAASRVYWIAGIVCALAVAAVAAVALREPAQKKKKYEDLILRAEDAEIRRDWDEAIRLCTRAIELDPSGFKGYWTRGRILLAQARRLLDARQAREAKPKLQASQEDLRRALDGAPADWPDRNGCSTAAAWVDQALAGLPR